MADMSVLFPDAVGALQQNLDQQPVRLHVDPGSAWIIDVGDSADALAANIRKA